MSIMLIISCYTGFFNVRRGWQSLNTGPRFYLRLIRWTGWLCISYIPHNRRTPLQAEEALGPISIPRGSRGVDPFRGLVPLGRRNLMPILLPAHPLWGGRLPMSIVYKYRILTSPAFQPCKYFCSTARKSILLSELKVKMLLFFKYNYFLQKDACKRNLCYILFICLILEYCWSLI